MGGQARQEKTRKEKERKAKKNYKKEDNSHLSKPNKWLWLRFSQLLYLMKRLFPRPPTCNDLNFETSLCFNDSRNVMIAISHPMATIIKTECQ